MAKDLLIKNDEDFRLGWISPEGDTYSCNYTVHCKVAKELVELFYPKEEPSNRTLKKHGWLKVIDSWDGVRPKHGQFVYSETNRITKKQADKLYDLGLYDHPEIMDAIKQSEKNW